MTMFLRGCGGWTATRSRCEITIITAIHTIALALARRFIPGQTAQLGPHVLCSGQRRGGGVEGEGRGASWCTPYLAGTLTSLDPRSSACHIRLTGLGVSGVVTKSAPFLPDTLTSWCVFYEATIKSTCQANLHNTLLFRRVGQVNSTSSAWEGV